HPIYQEIKALISLRNNHQAFKSNNYYFEKTIDDERVIEFIKEDDKDNKFKLILNTSSKPLNLVAEKIVYKHLYEDNILAIDGLIIIEK
ncbi:MAG: hypothetical protein ACRCTA_08045, partial [Bacilli bacterium]